MTPRSVSVASTDVRPFRAILGAALVVGLLIGVGCAPGGGRGGASGTTGSTEGSEAARPTTTDDQALDVDGCPSVSPVAEPDPSRPVYRADLAVDPGSGQVRGSMTVRFTPDRTVDRLVLRLWSNAPRQAAVGTDERVGEVRVDGEPVDIVQPDPTTVVVELDGEHPAGNSLDVSMDVALDVAAGARDRVDRSDDTLRLGSFLPLLAWVPGVGWAEDPATDLFAEATTTPAADFDVTLAVPPTHDVLATGVSDGAGRWRADAVRDFAASIGHFDLASTVVDVPESVEVTVGVDRSLGESPQPYLDRAVAALVSFSERFGPYPWPSLSLTVTPGLGGGIEMPLHLMQGPDTVGRTTPHEVAHMWFYGLVGNNQAKDPWMDEGLASFAEATFEESLGSFRKRSQTPATEGSLGTPLTYWADHRDDYYTGVYVQGALALDDLGPRSMVDCALRHYVADEAYAIAEPADLVDALASVFPDARAALAARGVVLD